MKTAHARSLVPRRPLEEARLEINRLSPKKLGLDATFRAICRIAALAIGVERVGIWLLIEEGTAIRCACLFERTPERFSEGAVLRRADFPAYFNHLATRKTLPAENASIDPRTDEMNKAYLEPLGIVSLLDGAILQHEMLLGVVCHEHTGDAREWTTEEKDFVGSVADLVAFKMQSAKLAEIQLQLQRTQLDEASYQRRQRQNQFAAGVAHDFKNVLTVIRGYADLIAVEGVSTECGEMARQILAATRKGEALARDLMALSETESRHPVVVNLPGLLKQLESMLRQMAGPRHLLQLNPVGEVSRIFFDPLLLERILLNLVANARDAMSGGGEIRITVSNAPWSGNGKRGECVQIEVTDQGIGIPPALQEKIFEPFFSTKTRDQGTGLGLAIVKQGIEQAGGLIEVVSKPGSGTSFRLLIPSVASSL